MSIILSTLKVIVICTLFGAVTMAKEVKGLEKEQGVFEAAKYEGYKEIIRLNKLLITGADINAVDEEGLSAIHLAAKYNPDPKVIELLVDHGANVNSVAENLPISEGDNLTGTPLYYALCYNPNYKVVELLLKLQQKDYTYPIYRLVACAARNPNIEVINNLYVMMLNQLLLESAVNTNTGASDKFLKLGAEINATYNGGKTSPLYAAVKANNLQGVDFLLGSGANLVTKYEGNRSVLLAAAYNDTNRNTSKIINLLLMYGGNINETDGHGNTALHLAVQRATESYKREYQTFPLNVIDELVNNYADVFVKNFDGETPLDYAKKHRKNKKGEQNLADEVIQILKQAEEDAKKRFEEMQACG